MNELTFDHKRIAEGYLKRPWLHKQVMEIFMDSQKIIERKESGLDIGCGAGLSSRALSLVCKRVTGTDISKEMIQVAKSYLENAEKKFIEAYNSNIGTDYLFLQTKAEDIEIKEQYDIITAAGVMNWVDETIFLPKVSRMLRYGGYFLVYDFWISDEMVSDSGRYIDWFQNQYLVQFPKPARKENEWTDAFVAPYGLTMKKQQKLRMEYKMSLAEYVEFMLLQSNVIAKVDEQGSVCNNREDEQGIVPDKNAKIKNSMTLEEARVWFYNSLQEVFGQEVKELIFEGYLWMITKRNYSSEEEIPECGCIYG